MESIEKKSYTPAASEAISSFVSSGSAHLDEAYTYGFSDYNNPYEDIFRPGFENDGTLTYQLSDDQYPKLIVESNFFYDSGQCSVAIQSSEQESLVFTSGSAWPNKTFTRAQINDRGMKETEIYERIAYGEMVLCIFSADIAKRALLKQQERGKKLEELDFFTEEEELEVSQALYFIHQEQ